MTDETTEVSVPEGALVQIRVHPISTKAVRVMVNGEQAAVVGPGQALAGFLPDSILVPIIATLSLAELRHITTPSDPNGPEGAPVPAEAEAPRIALV